MNIFALSVKQLRLGLFLCMGCIYTSRGVSLDYHELYRKYTDMEINGAKMFVKALQERVDTLFAYPGGTAIDLFDALYDAEGIDMISSKTRSRRLSTQQMDMHVQQEELESVW